MTRLVVLFVCAALLTVSLAACSGETSPVDRAEQEVALKERALATAQSEMAAASEEFCTSSESYVMALDRYGDVLNATAPTVGDVRVAGADLAQPRDDAFDGAEAALAAQKTLVDAQNDLADAQAALEAAQAGASVEPSGAAQSSAPLVPPASVDRVLQAEDEFTAAQEGITEQTPLSEASEQFNSAVVALEFAWLRLFADAGCVADEQAAAAAASAYTLALQQDLATAGYYAGAIDGVYGPETVAAVEALQQANGLPVTGTVDKATTEALQTALENVAGATAQGALATTAAIQQTLKLVGFWDGPVDGIWTPELTEAVMALQTELGVEPTGTVDAATIAAFEKAIADLEQPESSPSPTASPTDAP